MIELNTSRKTHRLTVVLMLALGIVFFFAAYVAINNIVAEQSRVQQKAVSPVYRLVRDELLRPLYIAETFASSLDFKTTIDSAELDETALIDRLARMEEELGLMFFVASERTRKQYFSDGRTLDLIEGEVAWYFEAKERNRDLMADLGQIGDVHLFFDVAVYNQAGEFLGYVGVGKRIQRFLDTFDLYKARYGYDFLFVNDDSEIILSSLPDLVVTDAYIPTLESLNWFGNQYLGDDNRDSEIIEVDNSDFLVSEFGIEELDWHLLLLVPLEARQAQVTKSFVTNALAAAAIVTLLAGSCLFLLLLYKRRIDNRAQADVLTGLPNRASLERRFVELRRSGERICAVIVDLDHFKSVNDVHGHDAGDRVLRAAADTFRQVLRDEDIIGRWGGEEFVMLIPATSIELGQAIAERARSTLEALTIATMDGSVNVTASFGIAFGSTRTETLADLLGRADKALYLAKGDGRNKVRLCEAA